MAAWTSRSSRSSTSSSANCARSWRRRRAATTISRPFGAAGTCCVSPRPTTTAFRRRGAPDRAFVRVLFRAAIEALAGGGQRRTWLRAQGPSVSDVFSNSPGKDFVLKPFQELIRASSRAHPATPYFTEAHDVLAAAKAGKPIELL